MTNPAQKNLSHCPTLQAKGRRKPSVFKNLPALARRIERLPVGDKLTAAAMLYHDGQHEMAEHFARMAADEIAFTRTLSGVR